MRAIKSITRKPFGEHELKKFIIAVAIMGLTTPPIWSQTLMQAMTTATGPERIWTRLIGSPEYDDGTGVGADRYGNVYSSGYTLGSIQQPHQGKADPVALSFCANGCDQWQYQWGMEADERAMDIAVTSNGESAVCGTDSAAGAFIRKFDHNGRVCWEARPSMLYTADRVVVDRCGAVAVVGRNKPFATLCKVSPTGAICWTRKIGSDALTISVAVDTHCHVYVAGIIGGVATVLKFDTSGNEVWRTQWDDEAKTVRDIAVDSCGRLAVIGDRLSDKQPFVQTFTQSGAVGAAVTFSGKSYHHAWRLAIDKCDSIYVAGSLGQPGRQFLVKVDRSLKEQWWHWLTDDSVGFVRGLAIDGCGDILVSGDVNKSIHGQRFAGKRDIFVMKLRP